MGSSSDDIDPVSAGLADEVQADCESCFGLCCVAPAFAASPDFALSKDPHTPCPNLRSDFRCQIHSRLRESGFSGCIAFDCYGAGQKISQSTFRGRSWLDDPASSSSMFEAFMVMRQLHEQLMYLHQALKLSEARRLHPEIVDEVRRVRALTQLEAEELRLLETSEIKHRVNELLLRVGRDVREARTARGER